ncbi:MAG TPA: hypothetical protein VNL94_08180 [Candidatus Binatia bacterium]|nr:hypothetical protein [Candidatus Binatia bacterium]
MRRALTTTAGTIAIGALSASVALAGGGVSDVAKGHGEAVSEVAKAVEALEEQSHGQAVSAIAKQHGAAVSEAAKAMAAEKAAAGKAKGLAASSAKRNNRD